MKTLGIGIDGIIRNFISQLTKIYSEQIGKPKLPLTNYNLIEHFPFQGKSKKEQIKKLNYFMYVENPLEIFGCGSEMSLNVMMYINQLSEKVKKYDCQIKLISKELGNSKPATLFFLSKVGCQVENIEFVSKIEDKWGKCDILLDVNPYTLEKKPEDKISIKFATDYNKDIKSNYTIDDIKILLEDEKFLEEIINYEFIDYQEIK